ncbi:lipocalin-like domain-containing protein [Aestuariivirga sp.]|uniref:lipocalin-like domain-containing protein n=1 Tax=Aestuariivirga sp. TaxID=2650926 RepID=UPI003918CF9C
MASADLIGSWKLVSLQFEYSDGGERTDMYGENPQGYLLIAEGGRMMTIIAARNRGEVDGEADEARLFRSMMAYSGSYRTEEPDLFITKPDVAWHPVWLGKEHARHFRINGDALSIVTAETTHPMFRDRKGRGVLTWRRE